MSILNKIANAGLAAGATVGATATAAVASGVEYAEKTAQNSGVIADKARENHSYLMGETKFETTSNLMEYAQSVGLNSADMVTFSSYYSELLHSEGVEALGATQALISQMNDPASQLTEKVANLASTVNQGALESGSFVTQAAHVWTSVSDYSAHLIHKIPHLHEVEKLAEDISSGAIGAEFAAAAMTAAEVAASATVLPELLIAGTAAYAIKKTTDKVVDHYSHNDEEAPAHAAEEAVEDIGSSVAGGLAVSAEAVASSAGVAPLVIGGVTADGIKNTAEKVMAYFHNDKGKAPVSKATLAGIAVTANTGVIGKDLMALYHPTPDPDFNAITEEFELANKAEREANRHVSLKSAH